MQPPSPSPADVPRASAPPLVGTVTQPLDPDVVKVWRVKAGLWWTAFVLGTLAFALVRGVEGAGWEWMWAALATAVLGGLYVAYVPRLRYRFWRYALRDEDLYLERGVLTRVHTVVPLRRIQHLDVSHDLIEREFDLGKLVVHTAGARSSSVTLPGLRIEAAEALRDELKHYILEDVL